MKNWYEGDNRTAGEARRYVMSQEPLLQSALLERSILATLERIEHLLAGRMPVGQTYMIGNTQSNLYLDYKGRKHLYLYSANALHLNLQDIGTLAVSANVWTNIDFRPNIQIFTTDQATAVPVWVLATDEVIALST